MSQTIALQVILSMILTAFQEGESYLKQLNTATASYLLPLSKIITVDNLGCLGAVVTNPPSGSVVANFEGAINAITVTCNVTDPLGNRAINTWIVGNFRGARLQAFDLTLAPELFLLGGDPIPSFPSATYDNQMTILNLTSELDYVVLYCGLGGELEANFTLRIYRKLMLTWYRYMHYLDS